MDNWKRAGDDGSNPSGAIMIEILRLGHRLKRDERLSTHVGLAARALGADAITYSGDHDKKMMESIEKITKKWGGSFKVRYEKNWRKVIEDRKKKKFSVVHLTMYGILFEKKIKTIKKHEKLLLVVGSEKAPPEVYDMADYNIAVTNQPHSEVAALAVLLHELGRKKKFPGAKIRIIPQEQGKKTKSMK